MTNMLEQRRPAPIGESRLLHLAGATGAAVALTASPVQAHEKWLLTPAEVAELAQSPLPALYSDPIVLGGAAVAAGLAIVALLRIDEMLNPVERRLAAPFAEAAEQLGPFVIRILLAAMLMMAAAGGLPRHGTPAWTEPTLFVPDLPLSLAHGWGWLQILQFALGIFLAAGLLTRAAGWTLVIISLLGLTAFGVPFLDYAPHFIAPALILAIFGGGSFALDRFAGTGTWLQPGARLSRWLWSVSLALLGGGFVYLGVTYKLTQPALLIAIFDHGRIPTFGIPLELVALIITVVEITAGALLALGRLTRPIALFLIGAFTFFAFALGEPPLFHANLYGAMFMLVLSGRTMPALREDRILPARQAWLRQVKPRQRGAAGL